MKKISVVLGCLFILSSLFAQDTGKVKFLIEPGNAIVKINNELVYYQNQKEIELPTGSYPVEIWAPKMEIFKDTLTVTADATTRYIKGLNKVSESYQTYRKERNKYVYKKAMGFTIDAVVVGLIATSTYITLKKNPEIASAKNSALAAKYFYEEIAVTPAEFQESKDNYANYKAIYDDKKDQHNKSLAIYKIPATVLAYGLGTYYIIKRFKKRRERPVYKETNPFLNSMSIVPDYNFNTDSYQLNIGFKF